MPFIEIILVLVAAGFLCWLVTMLPLAPPFPRVIQGVIIFLVILWIVGLFFPLGDFGTWGHHRYGR
jgi:hypothetical protein